MCYRFAYGDVERVTSKYKIDLIPSTFESLSNPLDVFPSDYAPVIFYNNDTPEFKIDAMKWGLIPFWAKESKIGRKLFNARIETLSIKPSFRNSFERYRCIVPVISFNETLNIDGKKQQFVFKDANSEIFSLAGIFSEWKDPINQHVIKTFTVITMPSGSSVRAVHDRMPVVLDSNYESEWLKNGNDHEVISNIMNFSDSVKLNKNAVS